MQRTRRRGHWCCSFTTPPLSPENHAKKIDAVPSSRKTNEVIISSSPTQKAPPLARRILSPGRVSPISHHHHQQQIPRNATPKQTSIPESPLPDPSTGSGEEERNVRLNLKGKNGQTLVLEAGSEILRSNSVVFAELIDGNKGGCLCRIEVPEVDNLGVFRETVEMMFEEEDDRERRLAKIGVFRAIDILEVSNGLKFDGGISSCLKYIAAVPWTEEEEEKLKELLPKLDMDSALTSDITDRLYCCYNPVDSQQRTLTKHLVRSITECSDASARNELKTLVKGLLCKSSAHEKELNKDDLLNICKSCLNSLTALLVEASGAADQGPSFCPNRKEKPPALLESISKEVDSMNWVFDVLLEHQMAEGFVRLWADQDSMVEMHGKSSPMVRYEVSRTSAAVFVAMGMGKVQCRLETRLKLVRLWFGPMMSDFGWLRRCKKGMDMKALEEAMGQLLLTLPLDEQYQLFMDWFRCCFSNNNSCPDLSKAFHIWWRRSFLRVSTSN